MSKDAKAIAAIAWAAIGTQDDEQAHENAYDCVFNALIGDLDWEHKPATEISDVAYEAATAAVARRTQERVNAWAADRALVADMERDGLL